MATMPGLLSDFLSNVDELLFSGDGLSVDELYASTECLLSDDIWKKFQMDFPDLTELDEVFGETADLPEGYCMDKDTRSFQNEITNHDCMWSGQCGSKEHPVDDNRGPKIGPSFIGLQPQRPVATNTKMSSSSATSSTAGRSLLLKPAARGVSVAAVSPDSPPMSDDEENKCRMALAAAAMMVPTNRILKQEPEEDFHEYFEEEDEDGEEEVEEEKIVTAKDEIEEVEEEAAEVEPMARYARENDHCYYMDKNAYSRTAGLGIDTPSDSEEEIDVVSVGEKRTPPHMVYTLPTNPSTRDRRHLQRRMATAITSTSVKATGGSSLRKAPPEPVRRRQDLRGVKRGRQGRTPASPHKRRAISHQNSDSEQEPSEKRSLHNNMERQRRIDLRNAFEDLRVLVPDVSTKEKAAKVVILREAAQYCYHLGVMSTNMIRHKAELKRQQEQLRARVSYLRRTLAAKR